VNNPRHNIHLDMLRGLASLGVVIGHTRSFVIVEHGRGLENDIVTAVFYLLTGLGHQCVITFFALSGFLVGGPALAAIRKGTWSFSEYLLRRLSRLWTVLIPALLLTLMLDLAGTHLLALVGYNGSFFYSLGSGPQPSEPIDLSVGAFIGNVLFLQTILTPVFGSNGPLWSLAYEFWYYLVFPFLFVAIFSTATASIRIVLGATGLLLVVLLPLSITALGIIWALGAFIYNLDNVFNKMKARFSVAAGCLIVGAALLALFNKLHPSLAADIALGCWLACTLPILQKLPNFRGAYALVATSTSNISYTLYATHFPVLALIWFGLLSPARWPVSAYSLGLMSVMVFCSLCVAALMWWSFERNTERIRHKALCWNSSAGRWLSFPAK
jgi:peptidoglycan/LPS O-acetylase OafA/YrhL